MICDFGPDYGKPLPKQLPVWAKCAIAFAVGALLTAWLARAIHAAEKEKPPRPVYAAAKCTYARK